MGRMVRAGRTSVCQVVAACVRSGVTLLRRLEASHVFASLKRSLRSQGPSLSLGRLARRSLRWAGGDSALALLERSGRLEAGRRRLAAGPDARRHPLLTLG